GGVKSGGGFALTYTDTTIGQTAHFKLGAGAHGANIKHATIGELTWNSLAGADTLVLHGTTVTGDCTAALGAGANTAQFDDYALVPGPGTVPTQIDGALKVTSTSGADTAQVRDATSVGQSCSLLLGNGANTVVVTNSSVG